MVHDLKLDILPKSYSLCTKDQENPNFLAKRLFLVAWFKAYTYNLIGRFKRKLPLPYSKMTVARLVRKFLFRGATLKITGSKLHVILDPFKEQDTLSDYCRWINESRIKISWLKNRVLKISFAQFDPFQKKR
jgi:hypothetical protein